MIRLFERYGAVEELQIDDEFRTHMANRATYREHRVSVAEIFEVHEGNPRYFENSGTRRAPVIMVGPTSQGRILVRPD